MQVYASNDLYAIYQPAASDFLLITFSHHGMEADGAAFWGNTLCQKLGIAALGFVSYESRWFPWDHMEAAIAAVLPQVQHHARRVTYGFSMGAFAALKYSRALGAEAAIAFSPQYSVDPDVVGSFETNFTQFFTPVNKGMEIEGEQDLARRPFIFFDRHVASDAEHVRRIALTSPQAQLVSMPHCEHDTARAFANMIRAEQLFRAVLNGGPDDVRCLASRARRGFAVRKALLSFEAVEKHPRWAVNITAQHGHFFPQRHRPLAVERMQAIAQRSAATLETAIDEAVRAEAEATIEAARTALDAVSVDVRELMQEGAAALKAGDKQRAVSIGQRAVQLAPLLPLAHHQLAGWLMEFGDFAAAEKAARQAMLLDPGEPAIILRHASAAERSGQGEAALLSLQEGFRRFPDHPGVLNHYSFALQKCGRPGDAMQMVLRLTQLVPENAQHQRRLSRLAFMNGNNILAHEAAEAAVALDQNDAPAWGFLSDLRHLRGDAMGALDAVRLAVSLAPQEPRWLRQQEKLMLADRTGTPAGTG